MDSKEIMLTLGARPAKCFTGSISFNSHHTSEDLDTYTHFTGEEIKAQRFK